MTIQDDPRPPTSLALGNQKYLGTGFFVAGLLVAYIVHQIVVKSWGETHDTPATIAGVVVGIAAVMAAWRNTQLRRLAQETIDELAAVTWPTREETYTATVVVLGTAIVCAVIIFGLDRFWSWFTDLIFR